MIIDLQKFLEKERPYWQQLETILKKLENDQDYRMGLEELKSFHYLYERAAAALGKFHTFAVEPETKNYLESLVSRAYAEVHESNDKSDRFSPLRWFLVTFPVTFRKNIGAFYLSLFTTIIGVAFGALALMFDPQSKEIIMPFPHLLGDPAERVALEESMAGQQLEGQKTMFSATLMTHNTKVSIFTLALGMTYGVGTFISLFYNGVILGAVALDYVRAGQTKFLLGWLLPHGATEIPAILLAGQAGLLLASALIGWGKRLTLASRLRLIRGDLVTLIGGVGVLLVWAGIIEAFFSQYHAPILPYELKIAFGVFELGLLFLFLSRSGRKSEQKSA